MRACICVYVGAGEERGGKGRGGYMSEDRMRLYSSYRFGGLLSYSTNNNEPNHEPGRTRE